jgi:hypothetical protein
VRVEAWTRGRRVLQTLLLAQTMARECRMLSLPSSSSSQQQTAPGPQLHVQTQAVILQILAAMQTCGERMAK